MRRDGDAGGDRPLRDVAVQPCAIADEDVAAAVPAGHDTNRCRVQLRRGSGRTDPSTRLARLLRSDTHGEWRRRRRPRRLPARDEPAAGAALDRRQIQGERFQARRCDLPAQVLAAVGASDRASASEIPLRTEERRQHRSHTLSAAEAALGRMRFDRAAVRPRRAGAALSGRAADRAPPARRPSIRQRRDRRRPGRRPPDERTRLYSR